MSRAQSRGADQPGVPVWRSAPPGRAARGRGHDRPIRTKVPALRIVDEVLWRKEQVQMERASEYARNGHLRSSPGLFSPLIACRVCGGGMYLKAGKDRRSGKLYPSYVCTRNWTKGQRACANGHRLPAERADAAILAAFEQEILSSDMVRPRSSWPSSRGCNAPRSRAAPSVERNWMAVHNFWVALDTDAGRRYFVRFVRHHPRVQWIHTADYTRAYCFASEADALHVANQFHRLRKRATVVFERSAPPPPRFEPPTPTPPAHLRPWVDRILQAGRTSGKEDEISAGYRILAQRHHPDRGGRRIDMQHLNAAFAWLRENCESPVPF